MVIPAFVCFVKDSPTLKAGETFDFFGKLLPLGLAELLQLQRRPAQHLSDLKQQERSSFTIQRSRVIQSSACRLNDRLYGFGFTICVRSKIADCMPL